MNMSDIPNLEFREVVSGEHRVVYYMWGEPETVGKKVEELVQLFPLDSVYKTRVMSYAIIDGMAYALVKRLIPFYQDDPKQKREMRAEDNMYGIAMHAGE